MKRFFLVSAAFAVLAPALAPAGGSAKVIELGQTSPIAAPACPKGVTPANCLIILTRTTAVQSLSDGVVNPTKVKQDGWIVAFTVGLSNLSSNTSQEKNFIHLLDQKYGGTPQLAISVLRPGSKNRYTVAAVSATFHLIPFLGQVLQEPFSLPPNFTQFTALPVKKGDVIGLSVPTWAPVLSYNLNGSKFAYRQSRRANCTNPPAGETAQMSTGASTQYLCAYTGTRVQYSVTEVTNSPYPKSYVH